MSGNSDKEIIKGLLDKKNWGCCVALGALAGVTGWLVVAGHQAMGLL